MKLKICPSRKQFLKLRILSRTHLISWENVFYLRWQVGKMIKNIFYKIEIQMFLQWQPISNLKQDNITTWRHYLWFTTQFFSQDICRPLQRPSLILWAVCTRWQGSVWKCRASDHSQGTEQQSVAADPVTDDSGLDTTKSTTQKCARLAKQRPALLSNSSKLAIHIWGLRPTLHDTL